MQSVLTIIYFRLFSQSKYFTWGILQSRKPKRRKHLGITFTLDVWREKTNPVYFIFFYFDLFPRVFLTNLAIPYILVINNAFKYPNRIACVWLVFSNWKINKIKWFYWIIIVCFCTFSLFLCFLIWAHFTG